MLQADTQTRKAEIQANMQTRTAEIQALMTQQTNERNQVGLLLLPLAHEVGVCPNEMCSSCAASQHLSRNELYQLPGCQHVSYHCYTVRKSIQWTGSHVSTHECAENRGLQR